MITKLKQLYSLDIYTNDEDRRLGRIQLIIILAYWALSLTLLIVYIWSDTTNISTQLLVGCLAQLIPLAFLYRGRLAAASLSTVVILIVAVTIFATQGQGIHDYTLIVFPAVIMFAGVTGRRRMGIYTTLLILLSFVWLVLGESNGWFVIQIIVTPTWIDLVNACLLLMISALTVYLLGSNLEDSLARARQELAERKHAEQALSASQTRLQMLTDATRQSFILLDEKAVVQYFNRVTIASFQALFGGPIQEGDSIYRYLSEADREDLAAKFEVARQGGTISAERSYHDSRGQLHTLLTVYNPVYEPNGSLAGICVNSTDISERKRAEQKLQESESQNRAILNSVPDILFRLNRAGEFLDYRANELSDLFQPPEFFLKKRLEEVLPPNITQPARQAIEWVFANNQMSSFEYDLEMNGELRHYENRIVPLQADQVLSVVRDITERRRAENALRESEALYHAMFDNNPAVKLLLDPLSGTIMRANQAAIEIYGYPVEQLEGMNINQINTLPDEKIKAELRRTLETKIEVLSFTHRLASGKLRDVEVFSGPVDIGGKRLLYSIIHDVTERNQAEAELVEAHTQLEKRVVERTAELREANLALEQALRAKDEFLATVSHELRTPLIGILGLSQALQLQLRSVLNEKQMVALHTIEQSGQRLHELVNDVLDYSRLQAGTFTQQIAPYSLERVCKAALQSNRAQAQQKNQALVFEITPENIQLNGDERRIKQAVSNLLDNAIKFSPEGGRIELTVSGLPEQGLVRICVTDHGIGIQEQNLARLFQPFTQLDSSLGRQFNGTGLGLALVRRLVELHGGRVEVQSVFGSGSTFTVYLPWQAPQGG